MGIAMTAPAFLSERPWLVPEFEPAMAKKIWRTAVFVD
jgi:hypothetical protein